MSFVPGDRHRFGLVLSFPLEDNLVLTQYDEPPYASGFRGIIRNESAIHSRAKEAITEFDIRTPSATVNAGTLSGGNQQKAVVAREFSRKLTALILDQPTRGLDVGSIEFIHNQVIAKRDEGAAILLVSAELDEVMELSDRVAVMYRGEIVETGAGDQVTAQPEHPYTQRLFMAAPVPDPDRQELRRIERRRLIDEQRAAASAAGDEADAA